MKTEDEGTGKVASSPPDGRFHRLTSVDIARMAGVSQSAVSLALNGRPGVSDGTRERILSIARENKWHAHSGARTLRGSVLDTVGLALARPASTIGVEPFFAELVSGLQGRLSRDRVALQLLVVDNVDEEIETYERWHAESRVGGVIVLDPLVEDRRPSALRAMGLPAVILGSAPVPNGPSSVWVDDYAAMRELATYLVGLGHRHLGHVSGTNLYVHTCRRREALEDIANEFGVEVSTESSDFSDTGGAAAARRLISQRDRPSALILDSDVMALAGLGVAAEMGLSVPRDLSLVSFDDSLLTTLAHPSITALSRDTYCLGETLGSELLWAVAHKGEHRSIQGATPRLAVRESTAPSSRSSL